MSWQMIRMFWFSFFALFFSAQAMACPEDQDTGAAVKYQVVAEARLINAALCEPSARHKQSSDSAPVTQSQQSGSAVAILHSFRWNIPQRYHVHDGDPDRLDLTSLLYPVSDSRLTQRFVQPPDYVAYQDFRPSYRLSGWKETNAMYVALNSHYFI
ncbi:hypothetical protein [Photobacterium halotolerans]|uniref:Lipoprotein n=1 Tax=Photobacterium halotolerans TaxID=265726 RepID=A0A0F5VDU8_9GAMM|nr:hypothetical protein [Photobacterium halotolerans]KKD00299.1 hypothetical protein KY46_08640 [Photobacterium halotolerans]